MKISYNWIKEYIHKLPKPEKLAEILTMHSFEVKEVKRVRLLSGKSDFVLDIDILPNRAHDCLSHIGIARECIALINSNFPTSLVGKQFSHLFNKQKDSKFKENKKLKTNDFIKVEVKDNKLCPRYMARAITDIKVRPSPKWLRERLEILDQKSINNIVDAANYIMLETGQPLHIFDFDKLAGNKNKKIIIRRAKNKEKFTTLDNEEYELNDNILVIADSNKPIAIAGIKGGKKAEIDSNTRNIVLESANFNPHNIYKTSRELNLRTEASLRFENGVPVELTKIAMERLTSLIKKLSNSKKMEIKTDVDIYPRKANPYSMGLRVGNVSKLLGIDIPEKNIINILESLGFKIKKISPLKNVLKLAKALENVPYKHGASITYDAPNCFDCSSFTSYLFAQSGIQIPRMSIDQYFFGKPVEKKDLKAGDLVFSNTKKMIHGIIHYESKEFKKGLKIKNGIDHCGLYLGDGKVIHAVALRKKIIIEDLKKSREFKNLRGFKRIITEKDNLLLITVPFWRLDIVKDNALNLRKENDLIEEIGRIYGYEKIPAKPPIGILVPTKPNDLLRTKNKVKDILDGLGMTEVYNYSFIGEDDLKRLELDTKKYLELENPLSLDLKYLRRDLIINLLKNIRENFKYFKEVRLFELGKVYIKDKAEEKTMLTGLLGGGRDREKLFYEVKGIIDALLNKLGITSQWYDDFKANPEYTEKKLWQANQSAEIKIDNEEIGFIGEINPKILSKFNIKNRVIAFNINFKILTKLINEELIYQHPSKYPAVIRDIAVLVNSEDRVIDVLNIINNVGGDLIRDIDLFDMYKGKELTRGRKNLAFHIIFQSDERTLTDKEVDKIQAKIIKKINEEKTWEVRK